MVASYRESDAAIWTDSSLSGFGGWFASDWFAGVWIMSDHMHLSFVPTLSRFLITSTLKGAKFELGCVTKQAPL